MIRRSDRRQWASAITAAELGELTARWLERTVQEHPGYSGPEGPDPETVEIAGELAALNRTGLVTVSSQPACDEVDKAGRRWEQRAAVEGFAAGHLVARLQAAIADHAPDVQIHVRAVDTRRFPWPGRRADAVVAVTRVNGATYTRFGRRMTRRFLRSGVSPFASCDYAAIDELCELWHVTVVDLVYGRNTMWPVLAQAANPRPPGDKDMTAETADPHPTVTDTRDWHMLDQLPAPGFVPDNLDPTTKIYTLYAEQYPVDTNTGDPLVGDFAQYRTYEVGERAEDGTVRYHDGEIDTERTYTSREGSQHDTIKQEVAQWASQLFGRPIDVRHNGAGDWELGLPPNPSDGVGGNDVIRSAVMARFLLDGDRFEWNGEVLTAHDNAVLDGSGDVAIVPLDATGDNAWVEIPAQAFVRLVDPDDELSPDAARWYPDLLPPGGEAVPEAQPVSPGHTATGAPPAAGEILSYPQLLAELDSIVAEAAAEMEDRQDARRRAEDDVARIDLMLASLGKLGLDTESLAKLQAIAETNDLKMRLATQAADNAEHRHALAVAAKETVVRKHQRLQEAHMAAGRDAAQKQFYQAG